MKNNTNRQSIITSHPSYNYKASVVDKRVTFTIFQSNFELFTLRDFYCRYLILTYEKQNKQIK